MVYYGLFYVTISGTQMGDSEIDGTQTIASSSSPTMYSASRNGEQWSDIAIAQDLEFSCCTSPAISIVLKDAVAHIIHQNRLPVILFIIFR